MGSLLLCIVSRSEVDYYLVSVLFFTQPVKKTGHEVPSVTGERGVDDCTYITAFRKGHSFTLLIFVDV